jgi:hypothetical protein
MWRKCVSGCRDAPFLRRSHNQAATAMTPEIAIAETLGIGIVLLVVQPASRMIAQQPGCLHGPNESDAQRRRRQSALLLARQINSGQAALRAQTGAFRLMPDDVLRILDL